MADSRVPWGVEALSGTISHAGWRTKPSWYLVVTDDKMIPPPPQRFMSKRARSTVVEVAGSHAIYVSLRLQLVQNEGRFSHSSF